MRARNIKPGFFANEHLLSLSHATRLLFIGLWLLADREGRLEDRPKKIKVELFPFDTDKHLPLETMLDALHRKELILRYSVGVKKYICIPGFLKHQRPHKTEKPSEIPAPPPGEVGGRLGVGSGEVAKKSVMAQGVTASHYALNPEPGILIPDSLIPESVESGLKNFPLTPEGLAQEFVFTSRALRNGTKRDLETDLVPVMAEMIRLGISPEQIRAEIHDRGRDRTEFFWQFKKRVQPADGKIAPGQMGRVVAELTRGQK